MEKTDKSYAGSPADKAVFFSNLNAVHIAFAISPDAIVPRITYCTTWCNLMHPTDFLWQWGDLIKTSTVWLFVRGSSLFFPASGASGDKSSAFVSPSWISSGSRKAAACTNCYNVSIFWALHEVKVHQPFSEDGKAIQGITLPRGICVMFAQKMQNSSLYCFRYSLVGHWRDLICVPACSKAMGRQPSSTISSFSVSSCCEAFSPLVRL